MDNFVGRGTAAPIRKCEAYVSLPIAVMKKPFLDALVTFVVVCQMALNLASNKLFIFFLKILFPKIEDILPASASTLRTLIILHFNQRKSTLRTILSRSQSQIDFSFDLWTSPNHLALLGVVGHWIDEFGHNQSVSKPFLYSSFYHVLRRVFSTTKSATKMIFRYLNSPISPLLKYLKIISVARLVVEYG